MLKFALFLVVSVAVCEGYVVWMSREKPVEFDQLNDYKRDEANMVAYCGPDYRLAHCFQHPAKGSYTMKAKRKMKKFDGKAAAVIYRLGGCTYDVVSQAVEVLWVVLDECDDVTFIKFDWDGTNVEGPLKKGHFVYCGIDNTCSLTSSTNMVMEHKWKKIFRKDQPRYPMQDSPRLGPVAECEKAYSCLSCTSARVCVPTKDGQNLYEISRFACTRLFPYCNYDTGSCTSEPDRACYDLPGISVSETFVCMRDGYFPDPLDCEKFYSCKNKIAYEHYCPYYPTPYYHPGLRLCVASKEFCVDKSSTQLCLQRKNHGRKVPVMFTDNYFITCGVNKNYLTVDRCIGAYHFNPITMMCEFSCPHAGLFSNALDCSKYHKCTARPQGGFDMRDLQCPDGMAFSDVEFACIDSEMVPNCMFPYPDLYNK